MIPLVMRSLNGNCIRINQGKISILTGREETVYEIPEFPFGHIFITGQRGFISMDAIRFLSDRNIPVTFLNVDGSIQSQLTHIGNYAQSDSRIRLRQYEVSINPVKSKAIYDAIQAYRKVSANHVLRSIGQPEISSNQPENLFSRYYFEKLLKYLSEAMGLPYANRKIDGQHNYRATNKLNALLNFAYHLSQYQSRIEVIANGLDPKVGIFHKPYLYKEPLVYDCQELIRYVSERAVVDIADKVKASDFNTYGNREYRCNPELLESVISSFYNFFKPSDFNSQVGQLRKYICGNIRSLKF